MQRPLTEAKVERTIRALYVVDSSEALLPTLYSQYTLQLNMF